MILVLLLFLSFNVFAQNTSEVDRKTYEYYLKADWKNLIKTGENALNQGIDFYYLRTRLAIAYYNLGKYRKAILHFQKANKFYDKSDIIWEYLYYSYLFSGRLADAYSTIENMSFAQRKKIFKNPNKKFSQLGFNYTNLSVRNPELLKIDDLDGNYNIKGEQVINYGFGYPSFYGIWRTYKGFITVNFSRYSYDNLYRVQEKNGQIQENPEYVRENALAVFNQFRLSDNFDLLWDITLATGTITRTEEVSVQRGRWTASRLLVVYRKPIFDISANCGIVYYNPYFDLSGILAVQSFAFEPNIQLSLNSAIYPFAKPNFYFSTNFIAKKSSDFQNFTIFNLGYGLNNKLWFNINFGFGQINYFSENAGLILFNSSENLLNQKGISVSYFFKKWSFFVAFYNQKKSLPIIQTDLQNQQITQYFDYQANVFSFGLTLYLNTK